MMRKIVFVLLWLVLSLVVAHFGLMYYLNSQMTQNRIQAHVTQFNKNHTDNMALTLSNYQHTATETDLSWKLRVRIPGEGWHEFVLNQQLKPGLFSLERLRQGQFLPILMDIHTQVQSVDGIAQNSKVDSILHFNKHLESTIDAPSLTLGQWQLNQLLAHLTINPRGEVTDGHIEVGRLQLGQLISVDQLVADHVTAVDHHKRWQLKAAELSAILPIKNVMYALRVQAPQYEIDENVQPTQSGELSNNTLILNIAKTEVGGQFGVPGHLADFGPSELKLNVSLNPYGMVNGIVVKNLNVNNTDQQLLLSLQGNALFDEGLLLRGAPIMGGLGEFQLGFNAPALLQKANQVAQQKVDLTQVAKFLTRLTGKPVVAEQLHAFQLIKMQYNARNIPTQWWFNQYQLPEADVKYLEHRIQYVVPH